ncbi:MAG: phospholipase D-like domain-containing protein [Myxococcota bacterium]|jgi:cardiolipin synthase|nr:phospholipase D-like domain-containing protein [Myxococcota bacterium]
MTRYRTRRSLSKPPPGTTWAPYCRHKSQLTGGNRTDLLVDGTEAFPAMIEAIDGAREIVLMDSYMFAADAAGRMFKDALERKARQGVPVYLSVDGVGVISEPTSFFEDMSRSGVHVLIYRSVKPWRRSFGLFRRNHRKLLAVDGRVGFCGGINVGHQWLPLERGGLGWHDLHLRLEGPAVADLARLAASTWIVHSGVRVARGSEAPAVEAEGDDYVSILGSRERNNRHTIRQAYLHAIRAAGQYVYIANAYFLPERGMRRALRNACERGVDVRVMVPTTSDILAVQLASGAMYSRLLKYGVRIFRWRGPMMHAKSAVVDDQWATVGSFNFDHRSWRMNLEVNATIVGPRLAGELSKVFLRDLEWCDELTREKWSRRSFFTKALEWVFFQFRRFL